MGVCDELRWIKERAKIRIKSAITKFTHFKRNKINNRLIIVIIHDNFLLYAQKSLPLSRKGGLRGCD